MNIDVLALIVGGFILVSVLICYSCAKVRGNCSDQERQDEILQIVYQKGYDAGYLAGDQDGYRAGIRRMTAMKKGRVDAKPGFDSVRPSGQGTLDNCKEDKNE